MTDRKQILEVFQNEFPERDYVIKHMAPEFTSLCPKTGQPDFATITLEYVPDELCIELKSLKLYYHAYRNEGVFYESLVNKILDDLVEATSPRYMKVVGEFNVRGGISSIIEAEYENEEYLEGLLDEYDVPQDDEK